MIDHSLQKDFYLLVFTDLDGTLLDHETYSSQSALPALNALKKKNIPLIICTSKTRAEIEKSRLELHNSHPFISENGGAIFVPKGYFSYEFPFHREDFKYLIIELGTSYSQLRDVFNHMRALLPTQLKGFGDLSPDEVADLCGFSLSEAKLAKEREYDEPFVLKNENAVEMIQKIASRSNFHVDRGGRFYHLMGENDKGKAVLLLKDIYEKEFAQLKTIALGDSLNDLPMLKVVDYPILVQKPDGSYDSSVNVENLIFAPGKGPSGWNDAILKLLDKLM